MQFSYSRASTLTFFLLVFAFLAAPHVLFGQDASRERVFDRLAAGEGRIPGQYIVVFKDGVDADTAEQELISRVHGEQIGSYRSVLQGFSARFSEVELSSVASDPRVEFVSEDREISIAVSIEDREADAREVLRTSMLLLEQVDLTRVFNEGIGEMFSGRSRRAPLPALPPPPAAPTPAPPSPTPPPEIEAKPSAGNGSTSSQSLPTGVNRINAESKANKGAGVHVAVVDTGIQTDHPDLSANIAGGKNCSTGTSYKDGNGHGTHVAGTIAALDNTKGVVGVAPQVKLWAVRVLNNSGGGSWSTVICGLDFVTSKAPANGGPITIVNLSLGGSGASDNNCGNSNNDALHKAICRARDAGVTVVVAAGNSGANAANFVPAAYDDAVIAVSALADSNGNAGGRGPNTSYGADDTFASFSNWGMPVDIGAPGVSINSTWIGSGYKSISGTSMASPHVAGAAALYVATHPGALWSEVRSALMAAGEALGAGHADPSGKHPEKVLRVDTL